MGQEQLFIPKTLRVGFNYREETYTKKLAYVIYYDVKGKLRKETSWSGWIQTPKHLKGYRNINETDEFINSFEPFDFDNVSTEGFVLNKGVGGQRESYGWNARNEYIRVYDPRGWEFEISVANLLFILQECTSTQGKGLEGEFVYSWAGKELVLLPVNSQDYKKSSQFTDIQSLKVTKKDMTLGCLYTAKDQSKLIYIGRYDYIKRGYYGIEVNKRHVFYDVDTQKYVGHPGFTKLAIKESDTPVDNFAELLDDFLNSKYNKKGVEIKFKPIKQKFKDIDDINQWREPDTHVYLKLDGVFHRVQVNEDYEYTSREKVSHGYYISKDGHPVLTDSNISHHNGHRYTYQYDKSIHGDLLTKEQVLNLDFHNCFIILDGGGEVLVDDYTSYYN